jgi:predicted RNA binding protein YcfA (HicA-like mRNA interferase family)
MPKLPGINHQHAVRALEKAGFRIVRQGKHIVMSDGIRILTIPRHNPVNAITMGGIVRDAGLTIEEFRALRRGVRRGSASGMNARLARRETTFRWG